MPVSQLTLFDEIYETADSKVDMNEQALLRGSGVVDGKKRIYEFALANPSIQQFANYLKNEYGTGGYGLCTKEPFKIHSEWHDNKEIRYIYCDGDGREVSKNITWSEAARAILEMVKKGIYPKRDNEFAL